MGTSFQDIGSSKSRHLSEEGPDDSGNLRPAFLARNVRFSKLRKLYFVIHTFLCPEMFPSLNLPVSMPEIILLKLE